MYVPGVIYWSKVYKKLENCKGPNSLPIPITIIVTVNIHSITLSCLYVNIHWYLSETMGQVPYRDPQITQSHNFWGDASENVSYLQSLDYALTDQKYQNLMALFIWHLLQEPQQKQNYNSPLGKNAKCLEISDFDPKIHRLINTIHVSSASTWWTKT